MSTHWSNHCGLSLVHFLAFPDYGSGNGPILESVEEVLMDDFFTGIEISRINDSNVRRKVASLIQQTHADVDFGLHPIILGEKLNLNSDEKSQRNHALETLSPFMDQAVELGAKRLSLLSGPDPGPSGRGEATKLLIDSLQQLNEKAHAHGLSVVLETFDREVDKKSLIGPAAEAAAVAKELRKDFSDFGLLYDQGHGLLLDEEPLAALTTMKEYVVHIHVGNCVKVPGRVSYGDSHPRFGYPGSENDVPELAAFIQALFDMGYLYLDVFLKDRPGIGFEIKPQPGESSSAILVNIKRSWRDAWNLVQLPVLERTRARQQPLFAAQGTH
jgi:sugar phosphate isomerase/epimerase